MSNNSSKSGWKGVGAALIGMGTSVGAGLIGVGVGGAALIGMGTSVGAGLVGVGAAVALGAVGLTVGAAISTRNNNARKKLGLGLGLGGAFLGAIVGTVGGIMPSYQLSKDIVVNGVSGQDNVKEQVQSTKKTDKTLSQLKTIILPKNSILGKSYNISSAYKTDNGNSLNTQYTRQKLNTLS